MFKRTYPGSVFDADGRHRGPGPWLEVIRMVNGLAHEEDRETVFGSPEWTDDRPGVEQYPDADVSHDFPMPDLPPLPGDDGLFGSREWERIARERADIRETWLRDPRNTVTITSKTPLGERLLTAAHAAVNA